MSNPHADELIERGVTLIEGVIPSDEVPGIRDRVRADILANSDIDIPALGKTSNLLRINQDLAPLPGRAAADGRAGRHAGPGLSTVVLHGIRDRAGAHA